MSKIYNSQYIFRYNIVTVGIDTERNYVTVTLCISAVFLLCVAT